jgi:hypothetical protein
MSKTTFTLTEDNSNYVIAVVQLKTGDNGVIKNSKKAKKLIAKAVKEEWIYEKVTCEDWNYNESNNQMAFDCILDGGETEIRAIDLNLTALYK